MRRTLRRIVALPGNAIRAIRRRALVARHRGPVSLRAHQASLPAPTLGDIVFTSLRLNPAHAHRAVVEIAERPDIVKALDSVTSQALLDMHEANQYDNDMLGRWGQLPTSMRGALQDVVTYAESTAEPEVRRRLRYVTRVLQEDSSLDSRDIIAFLASHGSVCNVMKEVAIRAAYGMVTNSLAESGLTLADAVHSLLTSVRELAVEEVYIKYHAASNGGAVNTHMLVAFRNAIAEAVGLPRIPDMYEYFNGVADTAPFWSESYTAARVLRAIHEALNGTPRKLSYGDTIALLEYNRPARYCSAHDFLYDCFGEDDGKFTPQALAWLLYKLNVFEAVGTNAQVEEELFGADAVQRIGADAPTATKEPTAMVVDTAKEAVAATVDAAVVKEAVAAAVDAAMAKEAVATSLVDMAPNSLVHQYPPMLEAESEEDSEEMSVSESGSEVEDLMSSKGKGEVIACL